MTHTRQQEMRTTRVWLEPISFFWFFFFTIHPTANQDKCAAFIFNEGGGLYSRQTISKRMNEFGFLKKIGSIEAYQAYTAENIHRVH